MGNRHRAAMAAGVLIVLAVTAAVGEVRAEEGQPGFLGLDLKGSLGEGRHSRYVPPVTNPILNETPYITTEARAFYFYNEIPNDFVTEGGHINLVALQLRLALTERLGFIATKDGYVDAYFDEVLEDEDGFANIALGFKYALYSEPETESLLTAGLRYEIPIQNLETGGIELQGNGDGFLNPFVSGTRSFGDFGLQASIGANLALRPSEDTSILHYSLHADYEVLPGLFPIFEVNGYTAVDNGNRSKGAIGQLDGLDALNFGSEDRDTTVVVGGGLRYQFNDNIQIGAGAETPVTEDDNTIMEYRLYFDAVLSF
ncbi:MAG: transporter [Kiloniellales bacterium]|nr:transporter [Kiloniellales bacterium]